MMKGKFVKGEFLPPRLPLFGPLVIWLLLDRFQVGVWVLGAVWTAVGLYCALVIVVFIISIKTREGAEPQWKEKT